MKSVRVYLFCGYHSTGAVMDDSDIEFEENYDYSPVTFDELDDVFIEEKTRDKALFIWSVLHAVFIASRIIRRWFN